ncbi:MAG: ExeA family protein [Planctomycetota bacterium]|jgi:general secretion pathway protein A
MDYLEHWGLRERPFENNRREQFFYPGAQHVEALERMMYLVKDGNMHFGLMTGEIGSGKTMVLHQFVNRLDPSAFLPLHIPNGNLPFDDLLQEILFHIERRPNAYRRRLYGQKRTRYELISRFCDLLHDRVLRLSRLLVVVIDEAQQLSPEALIELKNLTNLGSDERNAMSIVLAGQPELSESVLALPQIDQRVGLRFHLSCLTREEVGSYLDFRIQAAGCPVPSLFQEESKEVVYRCTGGIPREINRLCKLALDRSYSLGDSEVRPSVVHSIATDVFHQDAMV